MNKLEKRLQRKAKLARLARRSGAVALCTLPMLAPALAEDTAMVTAITDAFKDLGVTAAAIAAGVGVIGIGIVVAQYGPLLGINITRKVSGAATK